MRVRGRSPAAAAPPNEAGAASTEEGPVFFPVSALAEGLRGALRAGRQRFKGPQILGEAPGRRCVWRGAGEPWGGGRGGEGSPSGHPR